MLEFIEIFQAGGPTLVFSVRSAEWHTDPNFTSWSVYLTIKEQNDPAHVRLWGEGGSREDAFMEAIKSHKSFVASKDVFHKQNA